MLTPLLDTLPPSQRRLWSELAAVPPDFVLYGGTALALRLGHRTSEDFDFFSNQSFQPDDLERRIPFLAGSLASSPRPTPWFRGSSGAASQGLLLRRADVATSSGPERVEGPGFPVASLLDLAATKVKAVQDRAEAKDYIDLSRLLEEGVDLAGALGAARTVYGQAFNPILSLKALSYFADGDLSSLSSSVRSRLTGAVRRSIPIASPIPNRAREASRHDRLGDRGQAAVLVEDAGRGSRGFEPFFGPGDDLRDDRGSGGGQREFPESALREVLANPPAGVFDPRSWSYWHVRFGLEPGELPRRTLP